MKSEYPKTIQTRPNIDSRLGIKSSLPNVKQLLGAVLALGLKLDEIHPTITYSEEYDENRKTRIKAEYETKEILFELFGLLIPEKSVFIDQLNENPLFKSQIEALKVCLSNIYKLADINFIAGYNSTKERTGGNRFNKKLSFSLNTELILIDYRDREDIKEVLLAWIMGQETKHSYLEKVLIQKLTILSEETIFKIRKDNGDEVLFQQEGIYLNLKKPINTISRDSHEAVGPFRVLKAIVKNDLHPFLSDDINHFDLKIGSGIIDLNSYTEMLNTSLLLNQSKQIIYQEIEETDDIEPKVSSPPKNQIYYGAPGTGKSHKIKEILKPVPLKQQERVTFHPEYDNVSFVGGYMPISEKDNEGVDQIKYKFVPQAFTNSYVKAWQNLEQPYYLVIEEINRGNCAEIFGDMFQLLDRTGDYWITPSQALGEHLKNTLGESHAGIKDGKMRLPYNLTLLATMNTSDQSLFPMDSAFKRRWTWKYIPINADKNSENNPSAAYRVHLDETRSFSWLDFILAINQHIRTETDFGADKCIGNYFIKPETSEISLEEFINKAVFYLWVDVFQEEDNTPFGDSSYEDFFPEATNGKENAEKMLEFLAINIDTTPTETE